MLQHQTQDEPPQSARQRVTPEEFTKAMAAIEARKEQAEGEAAGTIAIGEAVQQLGLGATSDEVWQEVQAQRQRQTQQDATRLPRKTWAGLWISICFGFMLLVGVVNSMRSSDQSDDTPASSPVTVVTQSINPPTRQTVLKTVAEIADGETFWCDDDTASKILQNPSRPIAQVVVNSGLPGMGNQAGMSWVFTKHAGLLYLHGYIAPSSNDALQQGNTTIYNESYDNTQNGGLDYSRQITIRVGGFQVQPFTPTEQTTPLQITVSNIHIDQHLMDAW